MRNCAHRRSVLRACQHRRRSAARSCCDQGANQVAGRVGEAIPRSQTELSASTAPTTLNAPTSTEAGVFTGAITFPIAS